MTVNEMPTLFDKYDCVGIWWHNVVRDLLNEMGEGNEYQILKPAYPHPNEEWTDCRLSLVISLICSDTGNFADRLKHIRRKLCAKPKQYIYTFADTMEDGERAIEALVLHQDRKRVQVLRGGKWVTVKWYVAVHILTGNEPFLDKAERVRWESEAKEGLKMEPICGKCLYHEYDKEAKTDSWGKCIAPLPAWISECTCAKHLSRWCRKDNRPRCKAFKPLAEEMKDEDEK